MYAIVEIAGSQYKVTEGNEIYVNRLPEDEGSKVTFDRVLLKEKKGKVEVGTPVVTGSKVTCKILEHLKDDKVLVFKKKRRKGYKVKNGHRQPMTKVSIEKIS